MPAWEIVILVAYGVLVALTLARHVILSAVLKRTPFLEPGPKTLAEGEAPLVSIMVPAKDEEDSIAECLESLLAQDYRNLEILVVDDRSEDGTVPIVESFTQRDGRIRLIRVKELPEGWTGKTHALHRCQREAGGEWLLFVDADTRLDPSCVRVTLADALENDTSMASLMPSLDCRSFWERVVQPFAGSCLMLFFPLPRVNDPEATESGFANGQYILVKREAYDAIGGHEAVRDKFVEDIHLGRRIRQAGLGLRVAMAPKLLSVRMYPSLPAIVRGWCRILYSAVDGRPGKLYTLFAMILVFSGLSYAVLIGAGSLALLGYSCPFLWTLLGLGVAHQVFQTSLMIRVYALSHGDRRYLVFRILAVGVMLVVCWRTIAMCRTGQVVWRGTAYGKELDQTTATA